MNGGYVLVAERDQQGREEISALAERLGLIADAVDTGADALTSAREGTPVLVVLDVELTEPSAYEVCRELREEYGEGLPIVFVSTTRTGPNDEIAALLLGADDYFAKPLAAERFLARVRRLLARAGATATAGRGTLTKREHEVLRLLVEGRRLAEIASKLCITTKTASTHIEHILTKLGAHSQAQAVAFAVRDDLVNTRLRSLRSPDPV
ncbi:MAG TPA: response regulator transcription factor [Solirubrobacteraceae bacterium]